MTTEEIKAQASKAQSEFDARVAELKTHVGKTFVRNDGKGDPVKVTGYDGVKTHQELKDGKPFAVSSHTFKTEHGWTPPATKFLAEHHEVPAVETATNQIE